MKLGIFGATGAVGLTVIELLNEKNIKFDKLHLFSSKSGREIMVQGKNYIVKKLDDKYVKIDVAIFCTPSDISKKFCMKYLDRNCIVIDNSSAFRMEVPLIIPEINGKNLRNIINRHGNLVSNPNCSTIILALILNPLHLKNPIKKVVVSTYQAASGAGIKAMDELSNQAYDYVYGNDYKTDIMGRQYLWNVFSHNSPIGDNGYNEEENKIMNETKKIFNNEFDITATCVRVPVLRSHCESVYIEFTNEWDENFIYDILSNSPGITVLDDRENNQFPEPLITSNKDNVFVGRIRSDINSPKKCFHLFLSGDQLRKGSALNAIQIFSLLKN